MRTLTTSEWHVITRALEVAAETYHKDAKRIEHDAHGRLSEAFRRQAEQAERLRREIEDEAFL